MDQDNPQYFVKKQMLEKSSEQFQSALANLREEVARIKEDKLEKKAEVPVEAHAAATPEDVRGPERQLSPERQTQDTKPLIYFSYPVFGYDQVPTWTAPLREALLRLGYMVYSPGEQVGQQFGKPDLPFINALEKKTSKHLCSPLGLPEDVLLPYEAVAKVILAGDQGDNYGTVFKHLWFLVRSSLVVTDLTRPMLGAEAQELLYAKQLGLPTIGILPESGVLSPWVQSSVSVLLTAEFNLNNVLPLIQGYAGRASWPFAHS